MRAVTVTTPGGPDRLDLSDVPAPEPGPGDVLLRVGAAGVNPVDAMVRGGVLHDLGVLHRGVPTGVGIEVAGVVVAHGPQLDAAHAARLPLGVRAATVLVLREAPTLGYAELVAAPAADVAVVPDGLGTAEAATVPLNSLTAEQALDLLGPPDGRSLLVTGAAGAVGAFAAQLAVERGFAVTGLARAGDRDLLALTGAALVTAVPDEPVFDAVLDAAVLEGAAAAAVRDGGTYVGVIGVRPLASERLRVETVGYAPDGPRLAGLLERSARGELPVRLARTLPLADAGAAHRLLEAGGLRGRLVLVP